MALGRRNFNYFMGSILLQGHLLDNSLLCNYNFGMRTFILVVVGLFLVSCGGDRMRILCAINPPDSHLNQLCVEDKQ